MIHGPCGDINPHYPYMCKGRCSKHYPKKFVLETSIDKSDFAIYQRRDNGSYVRKKRK